MSDSSDDNIRRVGRRDRKRKLDSRKPLFPEDEQFAPPLADTESDPDPEPEAEVPEAPVKRAAPPAERFPPLDPTVEMPPPPAPAPRRRRSWPYNVATFFFVLATLAALGYFALLWVNPYHPLNPLPPFTPLPIIITATPLPPTATILPTETAPPTEAPTLTLTPEAAEVAAVSPTPEAALFAFSLNQFEVEYSQSASGCDWVGIAGRVAAEQDTQAMTVRVRSQDSDFSASATPGSAPDYGPGGFEIQVGEAPQLMPYTIQLFGPDEAPLSEEFLVVTSDQCEQNLVIVTFMENAGP